MYNFFMSLKQLDGSFVVSHNAEVDIRGIYCLFVVATLLDILTPELIAGVPSFIASIQTYEGGFAASSQPFFDLEGNLMDNPRPAMGEAHGGYTGCAVGAWGMLQPLLSEEEKKMVDHNKLLRWLVMMQGDGEDGGGFRGRSNKLVDGCYSWWVAGSLSAVTGMLDSHEEPEEADIEKPEKDIEENEWADLEEGFFNNRAFLSLTASPL
jgi:protein farnesyltransferase subunit beta